MHINIKIVRFHKMRSTDCYCAGAKTNSSFQSWVQYMSVYSIRFDNWVEVLPSGCRVKYALGIPLELCA